MENSPPWRPLAVILLALLMPGMAWAGEVYGVEGSLTLNSSASGTTYVNGPAQTPAHPVTIYTGTNYGGLTISLGGSLGGSLLGYSTTPTSPAPADLPPLFSGAKVVLSIEWSLDGVTWQSGPALLEAGQQARTRVQIVVNDGAPILVLPGSGLTVLYETLNGTPWLWPNLVSDHLSAATADYFNSWLAQTGDRAWGTFRVELWDTSRRGWQWNGWGWVPAPSPNILITSQPWQVDGRLNLPHPVEQAPVFVSQPTPGDHVLPKGAASIELNVLATASEPFYYQWTRNGVPVSDGSGYPSRITPTRAAVGAGATYACTATNARGTATTQAFLVRPLQPPVISGGQTLFLNRTGSDLSARFNISSATPAAWQWTGPAGDRIITGADGQLTIAGLRLADGGTYTLTVSNAEGTATLSFFLVVVDYHGMQPLRQGTVLSVRSSLGPAFSTWTFTRAVTLLPPGWGAIYGPTPVPADCRVELATNGGITETRVVLGSGATALAGSYECVLQFYPPFGNPGGSSITYYCYFQVPLPSQRAVLPAFTLPAGMIASPYASPPPPYEDADNVANTFAVAHGLPKGLSLNPSTGEITGRPQEAGTFQVTFLARNAKGSAAPRTVPLVIAPLPPGLAGTYLLWSRGTEGWFAPTRVDLVVAPNGSYTGKLRGHAFTGWLQDASTPSPTIDTGRVFSEPYPAYETGSVSGITLNVVGFTAPAPATTFDWSAHIVLGDPSGRVSGSLMDDGMGGPLTGWRRTVPAPRAPPVPQAGRYTFALECASPPGAQSFWLDQGAAHGTCTVAANGLTTTLNRSPTSTTAAFLGPHGEILSLSPEPSRSLELLVNRDGSLTSAPFEVSSLPGMFSQQDPGALTIYMAGDSPATFHAIGRLWVPPAPGQPLLPSLAASQALMVAVEVPDGGVPPFGWIINGKDQAQRQPGTLATTTVTTGEQAIHPLTLVLNRATGEYSGSLCFPKFKPGARAGTWQDLVLPYHGVIIQAADGSFSAPGGCEFAAMGGMFPSYLSGVSVPPMPDWADWKLRQLRSVFVELRAGK